MYSSLFAFLLSIFFSFVFPLFLLYVSFLLYFVVWLFLSICNSRNCRPVIIVYSWRHTSRKDKSLFNSVGLNSFARAEITVLIMLFDAFHTFLTVIYYSFSPFLLSFFLSVCLSLIFCLFLSFFMSFINNFFRFLTLWPVMLFKDDIKLVLNKGKAVTLHTMKAQGGKDI